MKQKIHIIGSCVTRDAFRIFHRDHLVGKYTSRSSLISMFSSPLDFDFHTFFGTSDFNWQQQMLVQDFQKNALYQNDYAKGILVIDFIDEVFKLLKIGNTFITKSTELVRWELDNILDISAVLSRGEATEADLWINACHKLTNVIPQSIRKKTVLHKAFWATRYIKNGEIIDFNNQAEIDFHNKNLTYYYSTFNSIYIPRYIIEVTPDKRIADADHTWGVAPFHYILDYYQEFYQRSFHIFEKANLPDIN